MISVFKGSWPLYLGMFMLMVGNGLQGTLLGLRADVEGFSTFAISIVMSAYFLGFLFGSRLTPKLIRAVGHVRVFAALGSMVSAVLILYPTLVDPIAWTVGRVIIGFCFCGVYITAESWLNDAATNETRGLSLSIYMIVQMGGIVLAQYIVSLGDVSGFVLFIIPSVFVSLAFAPILLVKRTQPEFGQTKPMSVPDLVRASPLASVGMFLMGGVFAAQFGMSAVYASRVGLSVAEVSLFVSAIYISALILQFPIGWLSDRIDRRLLIIGVSIIGGAGSFIALMSESLWPIVISGAIVGGMSNPLYALLIAYANDYLEKDDMAAASGGLLFVNGVGAIAGPLFLGWMMETIGNWGYWAFLAALQIGIACYAVFRMTRRSRTDFEIENAPYVPLAASGTAVAAEFAQEVYLDTEYYEHKTYDEFAEEAEADTDETAQAEDATLTQTTQEPSDAQR
ncbi:MFS transporter [Yoonia sp. 208BN28-4]|uniref:MFS transporter n=1 Tax=Yoonia sp. 208BN28-4 TaxID=3126505 RepID=UPI0030A1F39B